MKQTQFLGPNSIWTVRHSHQTSSLSCLDWQEECVWSRAQGSSLRASRRPCWWDVVVLAGRFRNGEQLAELAGLWLPCWSISWQSSPGCWVDTVGLISFLPEPALSVLRKPAPTAPSVFSETPREGTLPTPGMGTAGSHGPGGHRVCLALGPSLQLPTLPLYQSPLVFPGRKSPLSSPSGSLGRCLPGNDISPKCG